MTWQKSGSAQEAPIRTRAATVRAYPSETRQRTLYERALDALPDGVLLTDSNRRVVYCNPAFARHWRIPAWMVASGDEARMLEFVQEQLADPVAFLREVERINPTSEDSQDEVHLKDGRVLSRRSVPFEEGGVFTARLWIFTDTTEARHARIDPLCGVPNRRAYSIDFPRFVEAPDDGLVRAVGILDIDNFKTYNDHYGHAGGDLVLRQVGEVLRAQLRNPDDLVFRIGGEEFLLACKAREDGDAISFFEGVRSSIEAMGLTHAGNAPHNTVTASMGVGLFRKPQDAAELFGEVDAALYRAKRDGRNIIRLAL